MLFVAVHLFKQTSNPTSSNQVLIRTFIISHLHPPPPQRFSEGYIFSDSFWPLLKTVWLYSGPSSHWTLLILFFWAKACTFVQLCLLFVCFLLMENVTSFSFMLTLFASVTLKSLILIGHNCVNCFHVHTALGGPITVSIRLRFVSLWFYYKQNGLLGNELHSTQWCR